jgi:curved DNA-binding protein CbpA
VPEDYFALLNEPRRPWLDVDALKAKFFELSAAVHPDRVHGASEAAKQGANQRYAELNAAYNCLREPKSRLQHLLELEMGARPKDIQQIPPGTMELFMEVGQLCRAVDNFLTERAPVTSPILKVELFERAQDWTEQLNAVQRKLNARRELLDAELVKMNAAWDTGSTADRKTTLPLAELERLWRDFSYIARWAGQIQERIVQLSF